LLLFYLNRAENKRRRLESAFDKLLDRAIQYPQLESAAVYDGWEESDRNSSDLDKLRYFAHCCQVFNTIELAYRLFGGDRDKMLEVEDFPKFVNAHKNWWKSEVLVHGGYRRDFVEFINKEIGMLEEKAGDGLSPGASRSLKRGRRRK